MEGLIVYKSNVFSWSVETAIVFY